MLFKLGHVSIPKRRIFLPLFVFCAYDSSVLQNFKIFTHLLPNCQIFRIRTHGWRKWRTTALTATIGSENFQKLKFHVFPSEVVLNWVKNGQLCLNVDWFGSCPEIRCLKVSFLLRAHVFSIQSKNCHINKILLCLDWVILISCGLLSHKHLSKSKYFPC